MIARNSKQPKQIAHMVRAEKVSERTAMHYCKKSPFDGGCCRQLSLSTLFKTYKEVNGSLWLCSRGSNGSESTTFMLEKDRGVLSGHS